MADIDPERSSASDGGQPDRRARGRRFSLTTSRDDIIREEVADALAATQEERMEALIALLDSAYELWAVRGLDRDEGLCRSTRITQERRRGLCRDRGDRGPGARTYRATRDLDVLIEPTIEHAQKARRAVASGGLVRSGVPVNLTSDAQRTQATITPSASAMAFPPASVRTDRQVVLPLVGSTASTGHGGERRGGE